MSRLYDLESRAEDLVMIAAPIRIQGRGKVLGEGGSQGSVLDFVLVCLLNQKWSK